MFLAKKEQENIDSIMSHIVSEDAFQQRNHETLDRMSETNERWKKILRTRYHCYEFTEIINTWVAQWNENPEYNAYKANEVELLEKDNMLFLIPKESRKPIKVIIA